MGEVDKCPNCGFETNLSPRERRTLLAGVSNLEGVLREINAWYDAYPKPVFVEPTKEQWLEVHNLLDKGGRCSLADISASRRKHVLDGIKKIIDKERLSDA